MYMSKKQQQEILNSSRANTESFMSLLFCMRDCPITNSHKPYKTFQQFISSALRACNIKTVSKDLQIEINRFYQVQNTKFKTQYPL